MYVFFPALDCVYGMASCQSSCSLNVTWNWEPNNPTPPTCSLVRVFYHSKRSETRVSPMTSQSEAKWGDSREVVLALACCSEWVMSCLCPLSPVVRWKPTVLLSGSHYKPALQGDITIFVLKLLFFY